MGCLQSRRNDQRSQLKEEETAEPKVYSWDKRKKVDRSEYTIENIKGESAVRKPGSLNGRQFIIQNCENANIYLFDYMNTVTVDDCVNCKIFLGPMKTSIFVRDCKDCMIMTACQQFRARDCHKMEIYLCCVSQPIIESCTNFKFGCFQICYPELEDQFKQSGLSIYNNNWSNIHDFTPVPGEKNFSLVSEEAQDTVGERLGQPEGEEYSSMQISYDSQSCIVPRTLGTRRKPHDDCCLVVFFNDGLSQERAKNFYDEMTSQHSECLLVQSKELIMQEADAQRVFGTDSYSMAVRQGPVIGFEYCGEDCIKAGQETLVSVSKGSTGLVFISSSVSSARQQIDNFYNFADMQMNV